MNSLIYYRWHSVATGEEGATECVVGATVRMINEGNVLSGQETTGC